MSNKVFDKIGNNCESVFEDVKKFTDEELSEFLFDIVLLKENVEKLENANKLLEEKVNRKDSQIFLLEEEQKDFKNDIRQFEHDKILLENLIIRSMGRGGF